MKSYEQIAAAMYAASRKRAQDFAHERPDVQRMPTWEQLSQISRECWVAAAKQAAAELALVH